jgi:FkbM family methyltransferase
MKTFYSQFISKNSLVFDVGANIGNRTAMFAELGRLVVAIEPQNTCMKTLWSKFVSNPKVVLIEKALGANEGSGVMTMANENTISSLSPAWIEAVQRTGRFKGGRWEDKRHVEITTLDKLIERFGVPDFIKIDVEGYEFEVLSGLSTQVPTLSFEFTPEYLGAAEKCLDRLYSLGFRRFNYSLKESMRMEPKLWLFHDEVMALLKQYHDNQTFGDVYAR